MTVRTGSARLIGLAALIAVSLAGRATAEELRGTVVDHAGKPAGGAKIRAAKLSFMELRDVRESTADAAGAFVVNVGPGDWAVFGLRSDEGMQNPFEAIVKVGDGKPLAPVTVHLAQPTRFKGLLRDAETGDPVLGGRFALDDARVVDVDAQGRFEAPGLEMTNHEAYPLCPGYERKRILFDTTGRPDAELELSLPKAGKVVGRVVDVNGKSVPGAIVGLATSGSLFSGTALWEKCSDDGRYVYDGKPFGRSGRLTARAPGFMDQERQDVVAVDGPKPAEFDFTLQRDPRKGPEAKSAAKALNRRTVSGTITGPGNKPVADAVVRWDLLYGSVEIPETKTDAKGAFRLEGIPDATNVLSVMAKGLAPAFPSVEAGGDRQVSVELKPGATIKGRVVDDEGKPIEGAWVAPQIPNPKPNWYGFVYLDTLKTTTDRDGRFTLEGMPEHMTCDFVSKKLSAVRQKTLSPTDEAKNTIVLLGGGAIRGKVVDPLGNPVRNFRVQVGIPKNSRQGDPVGGYFAGYGGTGLAFTRDDGVFTITGLTAGNIHRLTVIADQLGSAEVERVEAPSINKLKPAEALTIKLSAPHALRVRVFQKDGKVVDGARVTVIQNGGVGNFHWGYSDNAWDDSTTAPVDGRGWAEFSSLAFGKGSVVVRANGFSRVKLDWAKDEPEFNVFVEPEAVLEGTVVDDSGKPVAGARMTLHWGQSEMMNVPIDEKTGRFRADALGAGKYQLSVNQNVGPQLASKTVDLESGKTTVEAIRVTRPTPAAKKP